MPRGSKLKSDKLQLLKEELIKAGEVPDIDAVSKITKIPRATVYDYQRKLQDDEGFVRARTEFKKRMSEKLERLTDVYVDRLLKPDIISKANPAMCNAIMGTTIDKRALILGEPTIIQQQGDQDEYKINLIKQLKERKSRTGTAS